MKKYIVITIMAAMLLPFIVACSSALDQAPSGKISLEEVFADNEKTMYYLNSCYSSMPVKAVHYFFWTRMANWCDDAWDADDIDVDWAASRLLYDGNASASSHPVWAVDGESLSMNYWSNYFARIRQCCVFLENIETANVTDENDRERWTAEAHLLRAYYYAELLYWFGCDLPIIEESFSLDSDFSQVTRSSYYEVVQFIIADCDAALSSSQLPWRITSDNEAMRVTKALAWAIKSRVSLFAASPLYTGSENHWEEAYQISKKALDELTANGYELYSGGAKRTSWQESNSDRLLIPGYTSDGVYQEYGPYAAMMNEFFCNSADYSSNPSDKETIYQLRDSNYDLINVEGIGAIKGYKSGTCPSQEMVDAYETVNGKTVLNLSKPYNDEKHLEPNYNTDNKLYDPQNPYANRDPRFYASIYYNGSKRYCNWSCTENSTCYENANNTENPRERIIATWDAYVDGNGIMHEICEPNTGRSSSSRLLTRTGYYLRKFIDANGGNDGSFSGARHKDYRLAEIYLNLAEAAANAGHEEDALSNVNIVRERVGMPDISDKGDDLILRIHNERRVEFAFEGNRYFDIRRWQSPDGDLHDTDRWVTSAHITHNYDGTYTYDRTVIRERNCWENKWLKVAIPLNEVSNMLTITGDDWQNPGW